MTFILETSRLRLRALQPDDLDFVALMLSDPMVMRFYPRLYTRDEAVMWIDRQRERYARDGHGLWIAEERTSGTPVGQVGLVMQGVDGEALPEVGYLLHHRWWKKGLATEAACAVRDWAFDVRLYARLVSLIRPVNSPSRRVAERIGMSRWKECTHAGLTHDVYAIDRVTSARAVNDRVLARAVLRAASTECAAYVALVRQPRRTDFTQQQRAPGRE